MVAMKIGPFFQTIFTGILVILLGACANVSPDGHPWITGISAAPRALVGTWTNSLNTLWTIKSDGTFDVVNPKRHIWGKYTVAGDTVTIQETGGKTAKGCRGPGVYKFNRTGNTLAFTLVNDSCGERKRNVLLAWHQK
jgi:hypothetical protein